MDSRDKSQAIARDFVLNEATFKYDGLAGTLAVRPAAVSGAPDMWEFSFEFQSRHSGYGDRAGKILLQVITRHSVRIVVDKEQVISAVMDGRWDMIDHKMLST